MIPLAQPPRKEDRVFDDWMYRLWKRISTAGGFGWDLIDTTGSNLTDLETRNHADLQNINSASYTHLTSTQAGLIPTAFASGDLILGNGTNTSTRLSIGASGYVLQSNGSTATWQPAGAASTFPGIYVNIQPLETYTIYANYQAIVQGTYTVLGTLVVLGDLRINNG